MYDLLHRIGLDADRLLLGNPLGDWLYALGFGLVTFLGLLFLFRQLAARTRRFAGPELPRGLRLLLALQRKTKFLPLLAVSLLVGSKYLDLGSHAERLTSGVLVVLVAVQLALWSSAAVRFYLEEQLASARYQKSQAMVTIAQFIANLAIWSLVALLALDNLGFQVKTLLAGLGIGGIAIALAVQNVLGDLFASVSIALDKPFEVGDALTLDSGYSGTVEAVGIKSTRLRSTSGEQIVVANAELVKARIRNYGRLSERRSVFRFVIAPGTGAADLATVPPIVCAAVEAQPGARFERAHLIGIVARGYEYEASFVVGGSDYTRFLDVQQAIHLAIAAELERRGIRLAPAAAA
ncbi:MAG TPA: mechanosensitive ion channel domain-containing protein [Steroidobacteraceae bacterium]|nr:mechanosensitive ion channel domain-containing protein [Steroidobacteraceae bacterium]